MAFFYQLLLTAVCGFSLTFILHIHITLHLALGVIIVPYLLTGRPDIVVISTAGYKSPYGQLLSYCGLPVISSLLTRLRSWFHTLCSVLCRHQSLIISVLATEMLGKQVCKFHYCLELQHFLSSNAAGSFIFIYLLV